MDEEQAREILTEVAPYDLTTVAQEALDFLLTRIDLLNAVDKAATRLSNRLNHAGEELEELDALDAALDALD